MVDAGLSELHGKSTFVGKMAPWLLATSSAFIGILLVELLCWLFVPTIGQNLPSRDRHVLFFGGRGEIFENHKDIFTYLPHNEVRNVSAFLTKDSYGVEYDYRFKTNNYGLVQDADIAPERESLLLLGDSFTEGQGAEPWFRLVSPAIGELGYQPINGGVLGTGFRQWLELDRYLAAKNIQIRKLVVLFISDDYHRSVWNITPDMFECLLASPLCRVDKSYFYRLPPPGEISSWIARVRTSRGPLKPQLKLNARALLPATYSVYMYFKQLLSFAKAEQDSHEAIAELVRIHGPDNIAFLHMPQKDELDHGADNLGMRARRAIEEAGGRVFDGFKLCNLTTADYFSNDIHPNDKGYAKIASCAAKVVSVLSEQK